MTYRNRLHRGRSRFDVGGLLPSLIRLGGLTFFKSFADSQASINADFAAGVLTGAVVSARSSTDLATYFDASGVMQTLTTADVPRWTQGFYDHTGWVSRPGILSERSTTNRALRSSTFQNAAWTKTNLTPVDGVVLAGAPAATVSTLTATAANATITQAFTDAVAGLWNSAIYVRRKTGTGTIRLRANTGDSYTDVTAFVYANRWSRIDATSSSLTNPTFDLQIATSGDELYVVQADLTKFGRKSSPIPVNAGTARTRPAETISFKTASNRTAAAESAFVRVTPLGNAFAADSVQRTLLASATKDRTLRKQSGGAVFRVYPNITDDSGDFAVGDISPAAGASIVAGYAIRHTTPYARVYIDGAVDGDELEADFADPAWGDDWYLGCTSAGNNQIDGIIEAIAVYGDYKDAATAAYISGALA